MMHSVRSRLAARGGAIAIVVMAIIDPAFSVMRYDAATVSVVQGPREVDSVTATQVRRALQDVVRVVDAPFAAADAIVYVGRSSTAQLEHGSAPLFVIEPPASVSLRSVRLPTRLFVDGRNPVEAPVEGLPAGNSATALLRISGVAVDRLDAHGSFDSTANLALGVIPLEPGVQNLRLELTARTAEPAVVDMTALARENRWKALMYEPRPSWASTFVRRALEQDTRITVVSRTMTSRGISRAAGVPPARLDQIAALVPYDVIIVGSPDALTPTERSALEQFMRARGGSVVMLLDQQPTGSLVDLITPTTGWEHLTLSAAAPIHVMESESSTVVSGAEFTWPSTLPLSADVLALVTLPAQKTKPARTVPAIWSVPLGGGRLFVSGATDSWKTRAVRGTQFAQFWQGLVGRAAAQALPPIRLTLTPSAVRPGDPVQVRIEDRAAILATPTIPVRAQISAEWQSADGKHGEGLALYPTVRRGVVAGTFRAPANSGNLVVRANSAGNSDSAALGVAPSNRTASGDDVGLLRRLAASTGGESLTEREIGRLPGRLARVMQSKAHRGDSHPMRSPWWIVPLALLLAFEWWSRRRSGLA